MAHEPFVNVRIYEGQGQEEKGDIARRVTRAICDATKLPAGAVWVVVEDVEPVAERPAGKRLAT